MSIQGYAQGSVYKPSIPFAAIRAPGAGVPSSAMRPADGGGPTGGEQDGSAAMTDGARSRQSAGGPSVPTLSPRTLGGLLKQQESRPTSWDDSPSSPPPAPPGEAPVWGVGYYLSSADKEMLTKATGYRFDKLGMPCDENGNRVECAANNVIGQIGLEREGGALKGAITPDYMQNLFNRLSAQGEQVDRRWLARSLDYLDSRAATGQA
ncbi:hypothetical protein [Azospirillum palustre]|nr:hypothetical protein [Azospirillum palustre]